jgi:CDP-glucose 4,6-dehydratase
MWNNPTEYCEGWNFGPKAESIADVWKVASLLTKYYGAGEMRDDSDPGALHEANLLLLDINKAKFRLGWEPRMNLEMCMRMVADWYKRYKEEDVFSLCVKQIEEFVG